MSPQAETAGPKKEKKMSSQFARTLVAAVAALLMSTVAVGAAVGPVEASAYPLSSVIGASLNA
jgi:hypothetical protein